MRETREEFAKAYAERSGITVGWLRENGREAMPCDCDYEGCAGWKMGNSEKEWPCCGRYRSQPHSKNCEGTDAHL